MQEHAMTDPQDNAKKTGDVHPPDVESDLPLQEGMTDAVGADGTPRDRGKATGRGQESRLGRGIKKAGVLKDKDDETSDTYGNTRESGEGSSQKKS
jgi:hypothetical protein